MTLSRDFSSSSLSIPSRDSADLCLGIATLHLQAFSAPVPSTFMLARKSPRPSACAASGILGRAVMGKPHSIPSRLVRLSSMNSIGSAHARLVPCP